MRRRYLLPILAIICTVVLVSFTTISGNKVKFICQWYIYDDPYTIDPSSDFPTTFYEATDPNNYRLATGSETFFLCTATAKLCAICAEPDPLFPGKPYIFGGDYITNCRLISQSQKSIETLTLFI